MLTERQGALVQVLIILFVAAVVIIVLLSDGVWLRALGVTLIAWVVAEVYLRAIRKFTDFRV